MKKILLSIAALAAVSFSSYAQKVMGYVPEYQWYSNSQYIQFTKYTDIIYSFMNPTTTGGLSSDGTALYGFDYTVFDAVKTKCKQNNVKLHIAIGGADAADTRSARLSSVCGNDTYRAAFVTNIVNFAKTHGLAGIDVDWEFPKDATAKANHLKLIRDLRAKLTTDAPTITLSMAVGGEYLTNPNHLTYMDYTTAVNSKKLIDYLDYVNIMAYDVPTNHPDAGQTGTQLHHSSVACAMGVLDAFKNTCGFPYSKMILGLPFYGKGANNRALVGGGVDYRTLLAANSNALNTNYVTYQGSIYYYNGKAEIETKITQGFAKGIAGVMVWDASQDVTNANSLATVMKSKVDATCPVPQPNLGLDQSVCKSGDTKTFDAGQTIGGATGITAQWFKDGSSISGQTAKTYTASAAGTYKVVLTKGTCSKEDEVVFSIGSNVTATGATACEGTTAKLSVALPANATNFTWWDSIVGGTQIGSTGRDLTLNNVTKTKSYYVEEEAASAKKYTKGRSLLQDGEKDPSDPSSMINYAWLTKLGEYAQYFTINQNMTVTSVKVYINKAIPAGTKAKLVAYNADGKTIAASEPNFTTLPTTTDAWYPHIINTNLVLSPGSYFITLEGEKMPWEAGTKNFLAYQTISPDSANYVQKEGSTTVFSVQGRCIRRFSADPGFVNQEPTVGGLQTGYGSFFDITVQTGAAASTCARAKADLTVNPKPEAAGTITGTLKIVNGSSSSYTVPNITGATSYKWTSDKTGVTFSSTSVPNPTVTFNPTTSGPITLTVVGTNDCGNGVSSSIILSNVTGVEDLAFSADVNVAPNPFENNFTLNATEAFADAYSVKIFNSLGALVYSSDVTNATSLTLGDNLSAGLYVIQVAKGERVLQTRIVKK